jgi:large repetitive protein
VPNGGFSSSSAVLTQTIIGYPTTTTVTCAPAPATSPLAIAYTITVTSPNGIPTGSISFSPGTGATIPSPLNSNGSITVFVAYAAAGTYTATATYVPTGGYAPSSATCTATVASLPTTTTFTATPTTAYAGQPITLNATTSGSAAVPTGTVTFVETAIGTSHLVVDGTAIIDTTGHAILNTSTLSIGTHIITASYPGNSIYAASTSNSVTVTILANPSDFTIILPNPTLTVKTGAFAATTAVLTSLNGFTDNLVINCPVLPAHLYCIGNPFPIQTPLSANGTVNLAITISTIPLPSAANAITAPFTLAALLSPFSLLAGILAFRRRTPLRLVFLLLAILPAAISLTGCGVVTIPYTPPGAPGTYTIPITATGVTTGITHTAQLTVVVTP